MSKNERAERAKRRGERSGHQKEEKSGIAKIERKSDLQVTFTRRRQGLFGKAGKLHSLFGADVRHRRLLSRSPPLAPPTTPSSAASSTISTGAAGSGRARLTFPIWRARCWRSASGLWRRLARRFSPAPKRLLPLTCFILHVPATAAAVVISS